MLVLANDYALLVACGCWRVWYLAFCQWIVHLCQKRPDRPGAGSRVLQAPPVERRRRTAPAWPEPRDRAGKFVRPASGVRAAVPGSQRPAIAIARSWRYGVASGSSRVVLLGTRRPTRLPLSPHRRRLCRVSCSIVLSSGSFGTRVGSRPVPSKILVQTPKPIQE